MVKFIDIICCYLIADILEAEKISEKGPSTTLDEINEEFILKLYRDSNTITFRTLVYFSSYNTTCFKYRANLTTKYWFDYSDLYVKETNIIKLGQIDIYYNNLWINL